jgi:hypothetical protein
MHYRHANLGAWMSWKLKFEPWEFEIITYSWLLQFIRKVDNVFLAKKSTSSTILTFFANYEIKHPSCGDECNFNKAKALLHPCVKCQLPKGDLHDNKAWTTCSNVCSSIGQLCTYKCNNFSSMFIKTIVEDISFYAPYI